MRLKCPRKDDTLIPTARASSSTTIRARKSRRKRAMASAIELARPYPNLTRYHARISERPSFLRMKEIVAPVVGHLKLPRFPGRIEHGSASTASPEPRAGMSDTRPRCADVRRRPS